MIIAISGKIGSGKGTVTKILKDINSNFIERFFAEKLKTFVADLAGVDYELMLTQKGKNTFIELFNMTLGEMMQKIGNLLRDEYDEELWIKSMFSTMDKDNKYLISDLRFLNECKYLKEKNAILLRINRKDNPIGDNSKRDLTSKSETQLDDYLGFDYVIDNDGTYQELVDKVTEFYMKIVSPKCLIVSSPIGKK